MPEMPVAGENQTDAGPVDGRNHVGIPFGAGWSEDGNNSTRSRRFHPVRHREKGVRGQNGTLCPVSGLVQSQPDGVHPGGDSAGNADRLFPLGQNDGIGVGMLGNFFGKALQNYEDGAVSKAETESILSLIFKLTNNQMRMYSEWQKRWNYKK